MSHESVKRGESLMHKEYGRFHFWAARRSMRFSKELRDFAAQYRYYSYHMSHMYDSYKYRQTHFDSNDEKDGTDIWNQNWDEVKRDLGSAKGGEYLAVHLRRKDFLYARKSEIPTMKDAIEQIKKYMKIANVNKVFIATDGIDGERDLLRKGNVTTYSYSLEYDSYYMTHTIHKYDS